MVLWRTGIDHERLPAPQVILMFKAAVLPVLTVGRGLVFRCERCDRAGDLYRLYKKPGKDLGLLSRSLFV